MNSSSFSKAEEAVCMAADHNGTVNVKVDIPEQSRLRFLRRVPRQLRENKKHVYDPEVLTLGPYHHDKVQFHLAEQLKDEVTDIICGPNGRGVLRTKILEQLDKIRHFYGGANDYGDEELAEMMLRDACFLFYYMQIESDEKVIQLFNRRLGLSGVLFMYRDVYMLENQIPLWLITSVSSDGGPALLCHFLSLNIFGDKRMTRLPWGDEEEEEPLHLMEALHRTLLVEKEDSSNANRQPRKLAIEDSCNSNCLPRKLRSSKTMWEKANFPFRSVTDLKAKGILFSPSSHCLKDITFSSCCVYGKLQLPKFFVTANSSIYFSNIIAFEMSPETVSDLAVTSYIHFMKTLIENAKDVKELREKGIVYSLLASDDEVVRMFKGIDTYGYGQVPGDVKRRIDEHCNNKTKTWMAELFHSYFVSPWKAIALFTAIFLLFLTLIQTYYTIRPPKS